MKTLIISAALLIGITISSCTNQAGTAASKASTDTLSTAKPQVHNLVSIIEVPVTDLSRAIGFYQGILAITITKTTMDGIEMGILPCGEGAVNIVLAKGPDYKPTTDGVLLYLNAGENMQPMLDKIQGNGGKIVVPKTLISAEMGYFAVFIDTEGNKMGVHSAK